MSTLQRPPFTVPRHDLSSQPKHRYFLQTRSRIIPLLERTILSYLRFSPHPTVQPLNQGPIHVRRLGTTMLDCIVPFSFEVPTPDLGCVDLVSPTSLGYMRLLTFYHNLRDVKMSCYISTSGMFSRIHSLIYTLYIYIYKQFQQSVVHIDSLYAQGYANSIVKGPARRVKNKVPRWPDMP
ncbi:hypothetical protein M405DRAFT_95636 [Rhizopogon salebrosus TDB-379]|nr:hypothetical protein M405DRAFT_95636 [Rhizopogon salebrosus TDB-379]